MEDKESKVDLRKRIVELEARCEILNEDKLELKEEVAIAKKQTERAKGRCERVKAELAETKEMFGSKKRNWREEDEKIWNKYWDLEEAYGKLQIDLKAAANPINCPDFESLKCSLEDKDRTISTLLKKGEALDRKNSQIEADFKCKMDMEANKMKLEESKKSALILKCQALEGEKEGLMVQVLKLRKERSADVEAYFKLQSDLKGAANRRNDGDEAVLEKLRVSEAEVKGFKLSLEERDNTIRTLTGKIESLDRQISRNEADFRLKMAEKTNKTKLVEVRNLELIEKFRALGKENEKLMAEVSKVQKESSNEAERRFTAEKVLKDEKKRFEEVLNAEKKRWEEVEAKNVELAKRIELLEQVEKDMQDEVSELKGKKEEEVGKILMVKKEMEVQISRVNMEKDEEINRILKEKTDLKEQGKEMVLEKDEVLKVLYQENKTLDALIEQIQMEKKNIGFKEGGCGVRISSASHEQCWPYCRLFHSHCAIYSRQYEY